MKDEGSDYSGDEFDEETIERKKTLKKNKKKKTLKKIDSNYSDDEF